MSRYLLYQNSINTLVPVRDHPTTKNYIRREEVHDATISRTLCRFDGEKYNILSCHKKSECRKDLRMNEKHNEQEFIV